MNNSIDLTGKTCLITGSSRGLGRSLALEFARHGASLVINSRPSSARDLAEVERQVKATGARVLSVVADVSLRADIERLAGEALANFGNIDVLVNNASALGPTPMPYLIDYPIDDFEQSCCVPMSVDRSCSLGRWSVRCCRGEAAQSLMSALTQASTAIRHGVHTGYPKPRWTISRAPGQPSWKEPACASTASIRAI